MTEEIIIYPSRKKKILPLIISIIFVILGIFLIINGERFGWATIGFFGIGMIVLSYDLFSKSSYLKLSATGFEVKRMRKTNFYPWHNFKDFEVGSISGTKMIMFDYEDGCQQHKSMRKLSKYLGGKEAAIPADYKIKAKELADLMNKMKIQAQSK